MIVTRKVAVCLAALTLLASGIKAQTREDKMVKTPNYALAERFSAKRVGQMVFSTTVKPEWFRNGNRFLYTWKTSEGTNYYIAEPATGAASDISGFDFTDIEVVDYSTTDYSCGMILGKIIAKTRRKKRIVVYFYFLSPLPKILEVSKYKKRMTSKSIKTF